MKTAVLEEFTLQKSKTVGPQLVGEVKLRKCCLGEDGGFSNYFKSRID